MAIKSYRDLLAWNRAMDFTAECYDAVKAFPKEETFGLVSQIRRAAVSIPSNIAEGHSRGDSIREYLRHLALARGSLAEVETHLLVAGRLGYLEKRSNEALLAKASEIGRILNGLMRSLEAKGGPDT